MTLKFPDSNKKAPNYMMISIIVKCFLYQVLFIRAAYIKAINNRLLYKLSFGNKYQSKQPDLE
jgi:hypothetical protein